MTKGSGRVWLGLEEDEKLLPATSPFDKEKDRSAGTAGSDKKKKCVTKLGLSLVKSLLYVTLQRLMCNKVVNMYTEERL